MRLANALSAMALVAMVSGTASAQDCTRIDARMSFCGNSAGWEGVFSQSDAGPAVFTKDGFLLALSSRPVAAQGPTAQDFDAALAVLLQDEGDGGADTEGADARIVEKAGIEGRRLATVALLDTEEVPAMIDIYMAEDHIWSARTYRLEATAADLDQTHKDAIAEVRFDE